MEAILQEQEERAENEEAIEEGIGLSQFTRMQDGVEHQFNIGSRGFTKKDGTRLLNYRCMHYRKTATSDGCNATIKQLLLPDCVSQVDVSLVGDFPMNEDGSGLGSSP